MAASMMFRGACVRLGRTVLQRQIVKPTTSCQTQKSTDFVVTNLCRRFSALTCDRSSTVALGQPLHTPLSTLLRPTPSFTLPTSSTQVRFRKKNVKPILRKERRFKKIYFSLHGGRPLPMPQVIARFYRLHNGLWIRTKAGRNKRKYLKSLARNYRAEEHVMCNKNQCRKLDMMVTEEWRRKTFFPEDPYNAYHRLDNLPLYRYKKPRFLP